MIHQALLSQFSQLAWFFIGKVPVDEDGIVLKLVNLTPQGLRFKSGIWHQFFLQKNEKQEGTNQRKS